MIDLGSEQLISLADAAGLLPCGRKGRTPDVKTLYAWTTNGCRGVVLESVQIGGRRCTSRESVFRFIAALTAASGAGKQPRRRRPNEPHNQALEAELDRLGVRTVSGKAEASARQAFENIALPCERQKSSG